MKEKIESYINIVKENVNVTDRLFARLDSLSNEELLDLMNSIEIELKQANGEAFGNLERVAYEIMFIFEKREKGWIVP